MSRRENRATENQTTEPENLRELLELRVDATPEKHFLFSEADGRRFTYAQFEAAVNRTVRLLVANGIGKGDRVSMLMPNGAEYIIGYFACFKLGALAGPINSLLKPPEIAFVIGNSEAKAMVVNSSFRPQIERIANELPNLNAVIEFDSEHHATQSFSGERHGLPVADLEKDDEAIIIYTSGTTGKPKGCLLSHGNLIANARQIANWLGFNENDRLLTVMPLFHMNAVSVTTMTPLYAGASSVVSPKFSATRFWQTISDFGVTSFGSVATMLSMLLEKYPDGLPEYVNTEKLRFALCGSAPVPAEVLTRFENIFNCLVIEGYGLSESTCRSTFNPPDERRRPGSCGMAIGNDMMVVDEKGNEVSDGTLGEIVLRGENVLKGYYKNPDANRIAFRGGWFHTGDVAYRDKDGYYFIVDRKSDMIIRAGENIYPREIDEVLYQHPAVAAAATIGVPDALYGEEVTAFVVLKQELRASEEDLLAHCQARLADYKCPKSIQIVEDIPKGPTGKLLKRELAVTYVGDGKFLPEK